MGIEIGDLLLQAVADRILSEVRDCSHIVSHLGGGEFVIIIGYYEDNIIYVKDIVTKLLFIVNKNFLIQKNDILISASIGICIFPEHTTSPEELLRYADMARYNAKQNGKNTYSFYHESMNKKALDRTIMYAELKKALENNEFSLHYQPKFCTTTNTVVGAEALIRCKHAGKGNISPDLFIPIAEESAMIIPIGKWILNTACMDLKKLQQLGSSNFTISINLCPIVGYRGLSKVIRIRVDRKRCYAKYRKIIAYA